MEKNRDHMELQLPYIIKNRIQNVFKIYEGTNQGVRLQFDFAMDILPL